MVKIGRCRDHFRTSIRIPVNIVLLGYDLGTFKVALKLSNENKLLGNVMMINTLHSI